MPGLQPKPRAYLTIHMDVHKVVNFGVTAAKQRAYSVRTKLQAIEAVEKNSKEAVASQFGVNHQAIWH